MDKRKYTKIEVINLIRFYCLNQRIVCQLPISFPEGKYISKEGFERICKTIKIDCDIEKTSMPLEQENFEERLEAIKKDATV